MLERSHWLHTIEVVNNSQPVKGKTRTGKMIDVFYSKSVWSTMSDLVGGVALEGDISIAAEYCPYAAHFNC